MHSVCKCVVHGCSAVCVTGCFILTFNILDHWITYWVIFEPTVRIDFSGNFDYSHYYSGGRVKTGQEQNQ